MIDTVLVIISIQPEIGITTETDEILVRIPVSYTEEEIYQLAYEEYVKEDDNPETWEEYKEEEIGTDYGTNIQITIWNKEIEKIVRN